MKVEILSSKFVKPSAPTPMHLRPYNLSFFDQLAPPAYPGIIFFFPSSGKGQRAKAEVEAGVEVETKAEAKPQDKNAKEAAEFVVKTEAKAKAEAEAEKPQNENAKSEANAEVEAEAEAEAEAKSQHEHAISAVEAEAEAEAKAKVGAEAEDEAKPEDENATRMEKLERSLSETLARFYPLAGKYIKDELLVDCNDQGVEVSEARADGPLAEILHGKPEVELLDRFAPGPMAMAGSEMSPVASIQITRFTCGGFAMGMRTIHKITDGFTAVTFIKEWATACREGIDQVPNLSFDLPSLFPARDLSSLKPQPRDKGPRSLVASKFIFDGPAISALKAKAAEPHKHQPSRMLVVMGLIWRVLIHITRAKHGHLRPSMMSLTMDLRDRTGLKVPKNAFGNLYTHSIARFTADESKLELNCLVGLIRDAMKKTMEEYAKTGSVDEIFSMLINYHNEIGEDKRGGVDFYYFTSLGRFPCYEVNFGWGQPAWVTTTSKPVELVSLMDTKCHEAVEAWVNLNQEDMTEFQRHPDIVAFSSQ